MLVCLCSTKIDLDLNSSHKPLTIELAERGLFLLIFLMEQKYTKKELSGLLLLK